MDVGILHVTIHLVDVARLHKDLYMFIAVFKLQFLLGLDRDLPRFGWQIDKRGKNCLFTLVIVNMTSNDVLTTPIADGIYSNIKADNTSFLLYISS